MITYEAGELSEMAPAALRPDGAADARRAEGAAGVPPLRFRHESLLYSGEDEFLAATVPLIDGALRLGHPVLVAGSGNPPRGPRGGGPPPARPGGLRGMRALGRQPPPPTPASRA